MGVIFAHQYTLKKWLKNFGDRAEKATTKELKKNHDTCTYQPMDATKLTQKGGNGGIIFPDLHNREEGWQGKKP